MNRRELKQNAKEALCSCTGSIKKLTLIFLLSLLALSAGRYGIDLLISQMEASGNYLSTTMQSGVRNEVVGFAISFALQMIVILLCAGYTTLGIDLHDRAEISFSTLMYGFQTAGRVILLYFLMLIRLMLWSYVFSILPSIVLAATLSGRDIATLDFGTMYYTLLFYVMVVIILVSYRYRTAFFLLMDHPDYTAGMALRQSVLLSRGHRIEYLLLDLSFLPWMLLSVLTCGILLIWKLPYMIATYAGAYRQLLDDFETRYQIQIPMTPPTE